MFVNRTEELDFLEKAYHSKQAEMIVIYGRRRIGKTTLIQQFIANKRSLYYMADKQSEKDLIARFQQSLAKLLDDPLLPDLNFHKWENLFSYWLSKENFSQKLILVFDEFQYLVSVNSSFVSFFQRLWDEHLKHKNILIILCGSLIHMMYSSVLSYSSPLYGRRTGQIKLEPIKFQYYHDFAPNLHEIKQIEFYAITGGVPRYIEIFDFKQSVLENIKKYILTKTSYLYAEPKFILNEELSETTNYFSILKTIAGGEHKIGNIAAKIGIKTNVLTKYLNVLIDLDILERQVPITEDNPAKSKLGLYFIKDHFFRFWFKYVFPNLSFLEIGEINFVLNNIKQDFNEFVSLVYEQICLAKIPELAKNNIIPFWPEKWGRWWTRKEEIDVVAFDTKKKNILFGECKWTQQKVNVKTLKALQEKSKKVKWYNDKRTEYYILFSKSGFTDELISLARQTKNLILISERDESPAKSKFFPCGDRGTCVVTVVTI